MVVRRHLPQIYSTIIKLNATYSTEHKAKDENTANLCHFYLLKQIKGEIVLRLVVRGLGGNKCFPGTSSSCR